jgi:hypothetical protein
MSILIRFCLRKGSKVMRKLLKRFLEKLVVWMQRKMSEDTISEKEAERILRDFEKFTEKNKVK